MLPERFFTFGDLYKSIHDDFAWFDEWANSISTSKPAIFATPDFVKPFKVVNEEDYIISPRKSFVERQIKEKEERLRELKERKANTFRWYEEQEKSLNTEIGNLKTQLGKKKDED
jgi:hypothetical protein